MTVDSSRGKFKYMKKKYNTLYDQFFFTVVYKAQNQTFKTDATDLRVHYFFAKILVVFSIY